MLAAGLLFAGALNKRFHFGEVGFEGFAAGGGEFVFRSGNAALEAFVANDVAGILEFAGMHTEVAVGGVKEAFEIREAQRVVDGEGADDAEAKAFVDDAVEVGKGGPVGRMGRLRLANEFASNESGSSHRACSRSDIQREYGGRRRWRPWRSCRRLGTVVPGRRRP
jgi:hypothetical protein